MRTRLLLALPLLALISCQGGNTYETDTDMSMKTTATLHWTGEIAADGCGFEVEIDGKRYLPENESSIPDKFKGQSSSKVQLQYNPLQEPIDRRCGMLPQPRVMPAIHVLSVEAL